MKNIFAVFLLCLCLVAHASEQKELSVSHKHAQVFFQNPQYSSPKIDPSGRRVSFFEHDKNGDKKLSLLDLDSNNMQIVYVDKLDRVISYDWIDQDTMVLTVRYQEHSQSLYKFDFIYSDGLLKEVEQKLILDNAYLLDPLSNLQDKIAIAYFSVGERYPNIYKIDLSAKNTSSQLGGKKKLNRLAPDADSWLFNSNGQLQVMQAIKEGKNIVWYKEPKKGRWVEIWNKTKEARFKPVLFLEDKNQLLVLNNHEKNFIELTKFNLADKTFGETVFKVEGRDIDNVVRNQQRDNILYASYTENGIVRQKYFTDLGSFIKKHLNKNLNARDFWVVDKSIDNSTVLALKTNSRQAGVYYLFESDRVQLSILTETKPWMSKFQLGKSERITSTSSDGLEIESFLTLPANSKESKPPLIVVPHGGPVNVRSNREFSMQTQYLASLGYAVLHPNYRGSAGYGKEFKEAAKQQWGKLIEDDIDSATQAVIDSGLIDTNKICIYGASYGGYSALISAIRRPDIYKCAASYVGVTDINLMLENDFRSLGEGNLQWIKKYYGDHRKQQADLLQRSPVYLAKQLKQPVFLAHSLRDDVVDIEHYYRMKSELVKAGNSATTLFLEKEGHGFKYLESYEQLYSSLDTFFRKSLNLPEPVVLQK
ncbi:prolyl oligopeptidase family serine peptidase [uncultured Pseudoteredinibacter sp.]|uniref:alpha/beta hydrolase family protein n=1 Tax=uncultured Pseudoteredinibacter sp. TaxID=1641701 RepID=UPI0026226CDA|nr:prolyl oligopeptidase family serine peptidase [uncultured Pseudoteredinibacter sp.]